MKGKSGIYIKNGVKLNKIDIKILHFLEKTDIILSEGICRMKEMKRKSELKESEMFSVGHENS